MKADRVLLMTRIFDAPSPLVFHAWTTHEHILRWATLLRFRQTWCEVDVRLGGAWRCWLHSSEGAHYWVNGVYREIVPNERLMFTHVSRPAARSPGHETLVTLQFSDHDARTELVLHQAPFASVESLARYQRDWSECLDRLADHLVDVSGAGA